MRFQNGGLLTGTVQHELPTPIAPRYLANLLAASGMTLLLSLYLTRHPELSVDPTSARQHVTAGWFLVAPMAVALIMSFFTDSGALWALLLLVPAQAIGSRLGRRAAPGTKAV